MPQLGGVRSRPDPAKPVPDKATTAGEFVALLDTDTLPLALPAVVGANVTSSVAVWLGVSVVPAFTPLALNPVPEGVTLEIVTLEFPLLVKVTLNVLLLPSFTFPKLKLVALAPSNWVAASPVPLNEMASGELGPLFTRETDPLTLAVEVGANATLKVVLAPAAIVVGVARLILKPAPDTLAAEIVTLAVPLFFRVMVCELLLPRATPPKLTLAGVGVSCACVPVPLKAIVAGAPGALLAMEMLPEALPVTVGANVAISVVLSPGLTVTGTVNPLMLKPDPDAVPDEIVRAAFPELVKVMLCVALLPTVTLPKLTLDGPIVSCG